MLGMKYGFIDESGAPGVAVNGNDFLVVSLVVFDTEVLRDKGIEAVERLCERLHLPIDYEFHCSSNSTRPQREFLKLIAMMDFRFITVAIRKNDFKRTASYTRMSSLLMDRIAERFSDIKLEMDSNPTLYTEIRKRIRDRGLRNVKIHMCNSRSDRLLQVADYVVNICAKRAKNTPKGYEWYKAIHKKVVDLIVIAD